MPIGAFLLVRKKGQIGAIRVTSIDSSATEWLGKSTWESFFQPDGSKSLVASDVVRYAGAINVQPTKGWHSVYLYQSGVTDVLIGKWKFGFDSPSMMTMSDTSFWTGVGDHGYEFAPTSACNLSEIDTHNDRLRWFRFDRNASITLPLTEIPK
jgi:hypothetical protein